MVMKPALTIGEQINLLKRRGLIVEDDAERLRLTRLLVNCNYYRLSGYWRYYQRAPHHKDDSFLPGTTVETIEKVYLFDETLRSILSDGLSILEVGVRSRVAYVMGTKMSPAAYLVPSTYSSETATRPGGRAVRLRDTLLEDIQRELERSREQFIAHHRERGEDPPVWAAIEALSFGTVSKMYRLLLDEDVRHEVARMFDLKPEHLESILRGFSVLRNVCAHHGRVWNRKPPIPIQVPRALKTERDSSIYHQTPWGEFVTLSWLVDRIRPVCSFGDDLRVHIETYPELLDGLQHPHHR